MVFSAVARVSSFEADDDVDSLGKKNNNYALLRHIDAVRSRMKAEQGKLYSKADLSKQKWNSPVSCSQYT